MYQPITPSAHPLDAAARAYALLGRISELNRAPLRVDSLRECVRALADQERQLQELSALLQELDGIRHELAGAAPASEAAAARAVLEEVLEPVESAARGALSRLEELSARRRALATLLESASLN